MARDITVKGGPLEGLSFSVEGNEDFTHHAAPGGRYRVNEKTATWVEDEPAVKAAPQAFLSVQDDEDGEGSE